VPAAFLFVGKFEVDHVDEGVIDRGRIAAGGSLSSAGTTAGDGYTYVASQMGTRLSGGPREVVLRDALSSAISTY